MIWDQVAYAIELQYQNNFLITTVSYKQGNHLVVKTTNHLAVIYTYTVEFGSSIVAAHGYFNYHYKKRLVG